MARKTGNAYISGAVPVMETETVPERTWMGLGRHMLALAKEMQGDRPDSFRDPATQADYELWKTDRAAWLEARSAKGD